jgi:hypothetical protein
MFDPCFNAKSKTSPSQRIEISSSNHHIIQMQYNFTPPKVKFGSPNRSFSVTLSLPKNSESTEVSLVRLDHRLSSNYFPRSQKVKSLNSTHTANSKDSLDDLLMVLLTLELRGRSDFELVDFISILSTAMVTMVIIFHP